MSVRFFFTCTHIFLAFFHFCLVCCVSENRFCFKSFLMSALCLFIIYRDDFVPQRELKSYKNVNNDIERIVHHYIIVFASFYTFNYYKCAETWDLLFSWVTPSCDKLLLVGHTVLLTSMQIVYSQTKKKVLLREGVDNVRLFTSVYLQRMGDWILLLFFLGLVTGLNLGKGYFFLGFCSKDT